jgi:uncharacterized protein (DUF1697 family)
MASLRDLFADLGYEDVRTHLQSGNVVFTSGKSPTGVARELERQIAERLGVETEVFVRTRAELARVVSRDPLGNVAKDPSRYIVRFLSAKPAARVVRELASADVTPEQFVVSGREIYSWQPGGSQRSKVAALLTEERLGVRATARNWKTVTRLLALADG